MFLQQKKQIIKETVLTDNW